MDYITKKKLVAKYQYWWASLLMKKLEIRYQLVDDLAQQTDDEKVFKKKLKEIEKEGDDKFGEIIGKLNELKDSEIEEASSERNAGGISDSIEKGFEELDKVWGQGMDKIKNSG